MQPCRCICLTVIPKYCFWDELSFWAKAQISITCFKRWFLRLRIHLWHVLSINFKPCTSNLYNTCGPKTAVTCLSINQWKNLFKLHGSTQYLLLVYRRTDFIGCILTSVFIIPEWVNRLFWWAVSSNLPKPISRFFGGGGGGGHARSFLLWITFPTGVNDFIRHEMNILACRSGVFYHYSKEFNLSRWTSEPRCCITGVKWGCSIIMLIKGILSKWALVVITIIMCTT